MRRAITTAFILIALTGAAHGLGLGLGNRLGKLGSSNGASSSAPVIDPSATAWKNAVVSAGGTVSNTQLNRVSTLIACYKSNNIWTIKDRLWLRASENTTQANLDIVHLQTSTPHGTLTFSAGAGYTGNGTTGYIDTNFNPATAGGNFSANSATLLAYVLTNRNVFQNYVAIGASSGGVIYSFVQPYTNSGNVYEMNGNTFPGVPGSNAQGLWINSRTSSTAIALDQNGVNVGTATSTSNGVVNNSIYVGAFDDGGSAVDFSTDQWAADGIGGGETPIQRAADASCLNAYMASLNVNVYASGGNPASVQSNNMAAIFSGQAASALPAFGINTHTTIDNVGATITPAQNLSMAQTLGVSLVRIDSVPWQTVESSLGTYSYAASDPYITGASGFRTAGMTVQLVLAYSNTLYESTIYTGPTDTAGKTAYNNYTKAVSAHYGATGIKLEVWNESNLGTGVGSYAWSPTPNASDFSTLANGAASAILGVTPGAQIITGGLSPGAGIAPNTYGATMNGLLSWPSFIGAGLHPYNNGFTSGTLPEQSISDTSSFKSAVSNAAGIYWSEAGYPVTDTNNSETMKAVYNARLVLSAIVSQVKQVILYELASSGGYGLFDASFNILPAGTAYKNLITAMSGCTTIDAAQYTQQNVWQVNCNISGGARRIVWCASGSYTFVSNETSISAASAKDLFGSAVAATISGNRVSVPIAAGGGPIVLAVTN